MQIRSLWITCIVNALEAGQLSVVLDEFRRRGFDDGDIETVLNAAAAYLRGEAMRHEAMAAELEAREL
jgi:hypothetical protein